MTMPAVSTTPPTTISLAAMVFALSRHVMKSAAHEKNRQLMAVDNTLATMKRAEVLGAQDIFIGVNALDYSGYPDCRPEYVGAFERMANLATKAGVEGGRKLKIHTPLIHLTKAEIIAQGAALGVDFALTLSCYDPTPDGAACGRCDACLLRRKGFAEAGLADPTRYRAG